MVINSDLSKDYQRIETALRYVAANFRNQPTLADIAASVHLSEFHFQRLFSRWAGVSPKQFLQYLTVQYARQCLSAGQSVLETTYQSGLSAPARLGELFVRLEAISPGEYRRGGEGLEIAYGYHPTPFGDCLIACTHRGITGLQFCDAEAREDALAETQSRMPAAHYSQDQVATAGLAAKIFQYGNCQLANANANANADGKSTPLSLLVGGTPFQVKVWEALLQLPVGSRVSYQQLASKVGSPKAVRAIGTAVGRNPLAVLIPCHRVIRSDGLLGGYHWGVGRKLAIQGWESAQRTPHVMRAVNSVLN